MTFFHLKLAKIIILMMICEYFESELFEKQMKAFNIFHLISNAMIGSSHLIIEFFL
jgi:hypothetical protein